MRVRFAQKATDNRLGTACRDGPEAVVGAPDDMTPESERASTPTDAGAILSKI
jgi:hypothetical protein